MATIKRVEKRRISTNSDYENCIPSGEYRKVVEAEEKPDDSGKRRYYLKWVNPTSGEVFRHTTGIVGSWDIQVGDLVAGGWGANDRPYDLYPVEVG